MFGQNSWEEQSAKSVASVAPPAPVRKQESITPRINRPDPIAVKQPSYKNLADAPSPSGRLGDRIVRLKQRCILALGSRAFNEAYSYLKEHAGDDVSVAVCRELQGEFTHFLTCIDWVIHFTSCDWYCLAVCLSTRTTTTCMTMTMATLRSNVAFARSWGPTRRTTCHSSTSWCLWKRVTVDRGG